MLLIRGINVNDFEIKLNDLLVNTFRSVLKVEEKALHSSPRINLSINEMHLLEAIKNTKEPRLKVSKVSQLMDITLPSATAAINKLVTKGYLLKERCSNDGRVMYVSLTELGRKIVKVHSYFHQKMVRDLTKELNENEKNALLKGIEKLDSFFCKRLEVRD